MHIDNPPSAMDLDKHLARILKIDCVGCFFADNLFNLLIKDVV